MKMIYRLDYRLVCIVCYARNTNRYANNVRYAANLFVKNVM